MDGIEDTHTSSQICASAKMVREIPVRKILHKFEHKFEKKDDEFEIEDTLVNGFWSRSEKCTYDL